MADEVIESDGNGLLPASADQLRQPTLAARIDGLRGMAWAYAVLLHTGYSASGASKRFSATPAGDVELSNSKLMYQYLRGDRAPTRGPRGRYGFDLVAAVDSHHTGRNATPWLDHPIWKIFGENISSRELEPFLDEEKLGPIIGQYWLDDEIPTNGVEGSELENALKLFGFEGYLYVCAMLRAANFAGIRAKSGKPLHFVLLEHLTPHAARAEPVFGFVQAPFLQMIRDFHFPAKK